MRQILICVILICCALGSGYAQYDFYVKSVLKIPAVIPTALEGDFEIKKEASIYYEFSNPSIAISYYPSDQDCGYFQLFGKQYVIKGRYDVSNEFGCNLDGETLEVFQIKVGNRNYLIVTSIAVSNGRGTRNVFCQLFDVTNKKNVIHYALWSVYGSYLSFGDYNNDGKLDFLEIRNDRESASDNDTFKLQLKTLDKSRKFFENVEDKYILFHQEYVNNSPAITVIKKQW